MIVFSDLDRSIIYSKRFFENDNSELEIELYNGENISYISKKTIELIKKIKQSSYFIPTTTRTIDQFKRISFSRYGLDFKYAITSNGGNILVDKEIDKEYELFIKEKLKLSSHIEDIIELLEKYKKIDGIKKIRKAEELFLYIVVDKSTFDFKSIEPFVKQIKHLNWDTYINSTKVYFVPSALKKSTAIKYICNKFKCEETCAIGDSIMDKDMLDICKNSYVLNHGDLTNLLNKDTLFSISTQNSFKGTEEILNEIILYQEKLNNNI